MYTMYMKRQIQYPDWVEKYRGPGKTIKKTKQGYGLYRCTSVYVKGSNPKSIQEYLGRITEDGFIPKYSAVLQNTRMLEYGFSHFLVVNFKRKLMRRMYGAISETIELVIIRYIFGVVSEWTLSSSYLTHGREKELLAFQQNSTEQRIHNGTVLLRKIFEEAVPDPAVRQEITAGLLLCSIFSDSQAPPAVPSEISTIIENAGLRL